MTEIRMQAIYRPSPDVVARTVEQEILIVPLVGGIGETDDLFSLNETGRAVWSRLDGRTTLGQVVDALAAEYTAPREEIEADVRGLMLELVGRKIVEEHAC